MTSAHESRAETGQRIQQSSPLKEQQTWTHSSAENAQSEMLAPAEQSLELDRRLGPRESCLRKSSSGMLMERQDERSSPSEPFGHERSWWTGTMLASETTPLR